MPEARSSRFTNLTPDNLAELAQRDDCVVYEPTHDVVFQPWPASRVKECVDRLVKIARRCDTEDEARRAVRCVGGDMTEFEQKYNLMFQRLTQPEIARNKGHVDIVISMIALRDRVDQGTLTEEGAQRLVSEQALAGLLSQAQSASRPT